MKERTASRLVVVLLFALGALCMTLRHQWRQRVRIAPDEAVWRLSYELGAVTTSSRARLRIALPTDSQQNRVVAEELEHPQLRLSLRRGTRASDRLAEASAPKPGRMAFTGRFLIHVRPKASWRVPAVEGPLPAERRMRWLKAEPGIHPTHPLVVETAARLRADGGSDAEIAARIHEYCRQRIARNDGKASEDVGALKRRRADPLGKTRALVSLCRAAQIPARLVCGFDLEASRSARLEVWAEVRLDKRWVPFDPVEGFAGVLPPSRVVVRRGSARVVEVNEGTRLYARFSVARAEAPRGLRAPNREHWSEILDVTRLPLGMHRVLATLLLLPFGAIIIGVFRNVVGLRTFGTFAPVLMALAFVFTDWRSGLLVLAVILAGGLLVRHVLNFLKLLMVARLGVVLTMVVTSLVLGISAVEYFSTAPNPQLVILPMVILTGLVEQVYITSEEDSLAFTGKLVLGTTAVSLCCYWILSWHELGRFVLRYPEVHLFSMGVLILIGRYAGYRLTELWRFHDLVRGAAPAASSAPAPEGPAPEGPAPEAPAGSDEAAP